MSPEKIDTLAKCADVLEMLAVSIPEMERADVINERVAHGHYVVLSDIASKLRNVALG